MKFPKNSDDFFGGLVSVIIGIMLLIVVYLISPFFVIVFPLAIVALIFIVFMIYIGLIWLGTEKILLPYVIPLIITIYIIRSIYLLSISKRRFLIGVVKHRNYLIKKIKLIRGNLQEFINNIKKYFTGGELNSDIKEVKSETKKFLYLIKYQYVNASIVLMAFLLILFYNYNKIGYNVEESILEIWKIINSKIS